MFGLIILKYQSEKKMDSNEELSKTKYNIDFKHLNMLMNTENYDNYINVSCINKAFNNFNKKIMEFINIISSCTYIFGK